MTIIIITIIITIMITIIITMIIIIIIVIISIMCYHTCHFDTGERRPCAMALARPPGGSLPNPRSAARGGLWLLLG